MSISQNEISDAENWLITLCRKIIKEELKQHGCPHTWIAIVDSYDSITNTANVHLPNDIVNIIPNIKNKSSETLSTGNIVELHSRLGSLSSCYIAVKY